MCFLLLTLIPRNGKKVGYLDIFWNCTYRRTKVTSVNILSINSSFIVLLRLGWKVVYFACSNFSWTDTSHNPTQYKTDRTLWTECKYKYWIDSYQWNKIFILKKRLFGAWYSNIYLITTKYPQNIHLFLPFSSCWY